MPRRIVLFALCVVAGACASRPNVRPSRRGRLLLNGSPPPTRWFAPGASTVCSRRFASTTPCERSRPSPLPRPPAPPARRRFSLSASAISAPRTAAICEKRANWPRQRRRTTRPCRSCSRWPTRFRRVAARASSPTTPRSPAIRRRFGTRPPGRRRCVSTRTRIRWPRISGCRSTVRTSPRHARRSGTGWPPCRRGAIRPSSSSRPRCAPATHARRSRSLLQAEPRFVELHYFIGISAAFSAKIDDAIEHLLRAYAWRQRWPGVTYTLAADYVALEEFDKAIEFYDRTLEVLPHVSRRPAREREDADLCRSLHRSDRDRSTVCWRSSAGWSATPATGARSTKTSSSSSTSRGTTWNWPPN